VVVVVVVVVDGGGSDENCWLFPLIVYLFVVIPFSDPADIAAPASCWLLLETFIICCFSYYCP